jgi:hypothetical protein
VELYLHSPIRLHGTVFFLLSLAPQPSLGLGLHKIRLNFLEASQQFSFYRVGLLAPRPTPILEDPSWHGAQLKKHGENFTFTITTNMFCLLFVLYERNGHHVNECSQYFASSVVKGNKQVEAGMRPNSELSEMNISYTTNYDFSKTVYTTASLSPYSAGLRAGDRDSKVRFPAGAGNFFLHYRVQNGSEVRGLFTRG